MDPEEVFAEVLKEEQGKGVSASVAEGRAKAARVRAEKGSPNPKEAAWWPGSQPHFEGGEAAAPAAEAAEEAPVEEAVEEAPAEAAPAVEEPAPAPVAETPAPAAPAPDPAPAEQPAAVATAPAEAPPAGVSHGTADGNRMRPEDGVATQAMFDGQQAVYQRRKLIDELVATGAPAITAQETGRPRAPMLALLYILIPLLAIMIVVSRDDDTEPAAASGGESGVENTDGGGGGGGGGGLNIVAVNIAFDTAELDFTAGEATELVFDNQDSSTDHNVAIYPTQADGLDEANALFDGEIFAGPDSVTYQVPALDAGEYFFQCDVHKNMNGTAIAK